MKKILFLGILAAGMMGCYEAQIKPSKEVKPIRVKMQKIHPSYEGEEFPEDYVIKVETIIFTIDGKKGDVILTSGDYFTHGNLHIDGKNYKVQNVVSGSGTKMATKDGKVVIHFKNGEGIIEVDGKQFNITKAN